MVWSARSLGKRLQRDGFRRRSLRIEGLETRRLLAGDIDFQTAMTLEGLDHLSGQLSIAGLTSNTADDASAKQFVGFDSPSGLTLQSSGEFHDWIVTPEGELEVQANFTTDASGALVLSWQELPGDFGRYELRVSQSGTMMGTVGEEPVIGTIVVVLEGVLDLASKQFLGGELELEYEASASLAGGAVREELAQSPLGAIVHLTAPGESSVTEVHGTGQSDSGDATLWAEDDVHLRLNSRQLTAPRDEAPMLTFMGRGGDDHFTNQTSIDSLLYGDEGDDHLTGGTAKDELHGGPGNDVLVGGRGQDGLHGGLGNDRLFGNAGADELHGGPGHDAMFGGEGPDEMIGDSGNDQMWGGDGNDRLFGNTGLDMLRGEAGNDALFGGFGRDWMDGGEDNDKLLGGPGNDLLRGWSGDDFLHGQDGHDLLFGHAGRDVLVGGADRDKLLGGDGDDALYGGDGNDLLFGQGDQDRLFGGPGDDRLSGGLGDDQLNGGEGDDRLAGDAGNDLLLGQAGDDRLFGGAGVDLLKGRAGDDRLWGNGERDVLFDDQGSNRFHSVEPHDTVITVLGGMFPDEPAVDDYWEQML